MTTTVHLHGPADVLAVLPYQLGFHPHRCLVAVSLHGARAGLIQRIDLPPPERGDQQLAAAALMRPLLQDDPSAVLLFGFEQSRGDSLAMLDAMSASCGEEGLPVADRIVVRDGRWFNVDCTGQRCCPREGTPLAAPGDVPAVAEFVGREISPLADRQSLARRLIPTRPLLAGAVGALADAGRKQRTAVEAGSAALDRCRADELAIWSRVLDGSDDAIPVCALRPDELARLVLSLTDLDLRDALIAWACPGSMPIDLFDSGLRAQLAAAMLSAQTGRSDRMVDEVIWWHRIERRLVEVCAAVPQEWAVAALTMLAQVTWWRGDGTMTRIALERALTADPGYRLARLTQRMVDLAIRPRRIPA